MQEICVIITLIKTSVDKFKPFNSKILAKIHVQGFHKSSHIILLHPVHAPLHLNHDLSCASSSLTFVAQVVVLSLACCAAQPLLE